MNKKIGLYLNEINIKDYRNIKSLEISGVSLINMMGGALYSTVYDFGLWATEVYAPAHPLKHKDVTDTITRACWIKTVKDKRSKLNIEGIPDKIYTDLAMGICDATAPFGHILNLLYGISECRNSCIVVVSEVLRMLHHSHLRTVCGLLILAPKTFNVQMFVYTNSYEALDAVVAELEEKDKDLLTYTRLERNDGGDIISYTLTYDLLKTSLTNQWEIK